MDTLKKLSLVTKALLPNLPQAFLHRLSRALLLTSVGTVLVASPGWAVVVAPTSVTVTVPTGTKNGTRDGKSATNAYVDDILLSTITFSGTTFSSSNSVFRDVDRLEVTAGRANINAEYGDLDDSSDGNPNPFVSAGIVTAGTAVPDSTRESTDPAIQDRALRSAFNSLSLSQGTDGEEPAGGTLNYTYKVTFDSGLIDDNNTAADSIPELIFFERGINSDFTVRAITGGTFYNPLFAPTTVTVLRSNMTATGVFIDTIEINGGQQLGVAGIDLNEFGITAANTPIYGVEISSINNSGADIYGQFAIASSPSQFRTQTVVPEPLTIIGSAMALGFGFLMQRQYSKKLKENQG